MLPEYSEWYIYNSARDPLTTRWGLIGFVALVVWSTDVLTGLPGLSLSVLTGVWSQMVSYTSQLATLQGVWI